MPWLIHSLFFHRWMQTVFLSCPLLELDNHLGNGLDSLVFLGDFIKGSNLVVHFFGNVTKKQICAEHIWATLALFPLSRPRRIFGSMRKAHRCVQFCQSIASRLSHKLGFARPAKSSSGKDRGNDFVSLVSPFSQSLTS